MTASGVLIASLVVLVGVAFVTIGHWSAAHPERLVADHIPRADRAAKAAQIGRSARRSQVVGVALLCLAAAAAVVELA